jgi:hypothetical protein
MKNAIFLSLIFLIVFTIIPLANAISQFDFKISNIHYQSPIDNNGANVGYTVNVTSNGNPVTPSCSPISGSLFPLGNTPVYCTATDNVGVTDSTSFIITVEGSDSTPPSITPPPNITEYQTGTLTTVSLGEPLVNDDTDLFPLVTNDHSSSEFPLGTTIVTWTVTDHSGNSSTATQTVTIRVFVDVNVSANPVGGIYTAAQSVELEATDTVPIYYTADGTVPTESSAIYVDPIPIVSNLTLKFFATADENGNPLEVTAETYTIDASPPAITLIGTSPTLVLQGSSYVDSGATASDNLDGDLTSSIITVNPVNTSVLGTYTVTYNVSDSAGNAATQVTRTVKVISAATTTQMQDQTINTGQNIHSGRQIQAEYVDAGSFLVGKSIDSITLQLRKTGSPTGTAEIGIFNTDRTVKQLFATKDVSTFTGSYVDYTFSLPLGQTYQIQSGDRIGIKYTGGDATTNFLSITRDTTPADPFDSTNSYRVSYTTFWGSSTTEDLYMILKVNDAVLGLGDITLPVISLAGSDPVEVQLDSSYVDAGATANDNLDGNITPSIVTINPVNTSVLGTYTVTYNVSDTAGNAATQVTRTVNVVDNTIPIVSAIPIAGIYNSTQIISLESTASSIIHYTTNGDTPTTASPVYNTPMPINADVTIKSFAKTLTGNSGPVDTFSYVIDTISPVITLNGNDHVVVDVFSTYDDEGATATDNMDGDITSEIITTNPVDTSVLGIYNVIYDVSDDAENLSQESREVSVVDQTLPVITLLGSNPVIVNQGESYVDAGATANDNLDGNITSSIITVNPVDILIIDTYTVRYNVVDSSENVASEVVRTIHVVDPNVTCLPPTSGSWIIYSDCTLSTNAVAPGNVSVINNSVLTIPDGITLDIDFSLFNLTIESGSGVLIKSGGTIN